MCVRAIPACCQENPGAKITRAECIFHSAHLSRMHHCRSAGKLASTVFGPALQVRDHTLSIREPLVRQCPAQLPCLTAASWLSNNKQIGRFCHRGCTTHLALWATMISRGASSIQRSGTMHGPRHTCVRLITSSSMADHSVSFEPPIFVATFSCERKAQNENLCRARKNCMRLTALRSEPPCARCLVRASVFFIRVAMHGRRLKASTPTLGYVLPAWRRCSGCLLSKTLKHQLLRGRERRCRLWKPFNHCALCGNRAQELLASTAQAEHVNKDKINVLNQLRGKIIGHLELCHGSGCFVQSALSQALGGIK
jgi:hypothetical protein